MRLRDDEYYTGLIFNDGKFPGLLVMWRPTFMWRFTVRFGRNALDVGQNGWRFFAHRWIVRP